MRLTPGSLPWLLAHDLTLNWRRFAEMFGRLRLAAVVTVCVAGVTVLHLLAWPAMIWVTRLQPDDASITSAMTILTLAVLAWMSAQGLIGAARTLQERGSLDLLLASPLHVRTILAARAMATAASSFGSGAILMLPAANVAALLDGPAWLGVYPTLIALALIGTTAGLAAGIGLFLVFPPRRARLFAQLSAAVIGGAFLLAMQVAALLPAAARSAVADHVAHWAGAMPGLARLLDLPAMAFRGDPSSLIWFAAIAIGLFVAAIVLLSGSFVRAGLRAAGAPADPARMHKDRGPQQHRFGAGLRQTLRRKEWRLLWRDHNVFAQLSLQIVYTLPLAVVLLRGVENIPLVVALAPAIVVISAQLAASLAWITVSGEDAPELIAAAPVQRTDVELAKMTAIAVPVMAIVALPFAGLALLSPHVALLSAVFAAAASLSTALMNLWHPMPGNRRGMLRRHSQSKVMALMEHLMAMLWAIAIVLAIAGTAWVLLPVALAAALLLYCRQARSASSSDQRAPATAARRGQPAVPAGRAAL